VLFRERLWTYALVTVVAILIWYWAAAETRDSKSGAFRLRLAPAAPAEQVVTPRELQVTVDMDGSALALEKTRRLEIPLTLTVGDELPAAAGVHRVNLLESLRRHEPLTKTGVRLLAVDPPYVDIATDALVPVPLPVQAVLPGVETEGEVKVTPPQVTVLMPSRLQELAGDDLEVEALVLQQRLEQLEPGVLHTISAKLRLPARFAGEKSITISPDTATIEFAVRSRIKQTTLPTVRVQVAGPPEDHDEFLIEIEDSTLADVTVKANADLIRRIELNQVVVVALVHLSHDEKEKRIASKPVTCFMALPRDETSPMPATIVEAEVGDGTQPPVVRLRITDRATG
jgi:hypothetical protein